jgi:hypothetical protein
MFHAGRWQDVCHLGNIETLLSCSFDKGRIWLLKTRKNLAPPCPCGTICGPRTPEKLEESMVLAAAHTSRDSARLILDSLHMTLAPLAHLLF